MNAFEATVEILKVRLANLSVMPKSDEAEKISEYAEIIYNKFRELNDKEYKTLD